MAVKQPNIVYIHSHDTGRYVQPHGHAIPTPRIQALAEEGVLFRQAFNGGPTCSPSRAALLTGQTPHSCGQFGLVNRGFELRDKHKHLAHTLRAAGYHAALAGVHHVVRDPLSCGYHEQLETPGRGDHGVAEAASDFLARKHDAPFFLAVGFFSTHRGFPRPEDDTLANTCQPPAPLPDTPRTRADMAAFKASAKILDACVGTVLDAIEANGFADDTLVICTTDHGIAFPGMKCTLTDHGTGVMLLMRGPGGFGGGKCLDALVSHIDLFPTICEVAGIVEPDWLQGKSLLPLVNGETESIRDEVFNEVNYHCAYEPMRAVRTERWKYIRRYAEYDRALPSNIDESISKDAWMGLGYAERRVAKEELYDLAFDPNEACNLATAPEASDALGEMRTRLERWMQETADPLLSGTIDLPDGAFANPPEDASPQDIWSYTDRPKGYS